MKIFQFDENDLLILKIDRETRSRIFFVAYNINLGNPSIKWKPTEKRCIGRCKDPCVNLSSSLLVVNMNVLSISENYVPGTLVSFQSFFHLRVISFERRRISTGMKIKDVSWKSRGTADARNTVKRQNRVNYHQHYHSNIFNDIFNGTALKSLFSFNIFVMYIFEKL